MMDWSINGILLFLRDTRFLEILLISFAPSATADTIFIIKRNHDTNQLEKRE